MDRVTEKDGARRQSKHKQNEQEIVKTLWEGEKSCVFERRVCSRRRKEWGEGERDASHNHTINELQCCASLNDDDDDDEDDDDGRRKTRMRLNSLFGLWQL